LRDQLTAELKDFHSAEDAANWARRVLAAKNTLTVPDAECVEQAFQAKLASIASDRPDDQLVAQQAVAVLPRADQGRMRRKCRES
jgi:hypothetical protein